MDTEPKPLLRRMFQAALDAADPAARIPDCLPAPPKGRTVVIGAGKAAAAMARALEDAYEGALTGLVVTRYGHAVPTRRIEVVEAAHPVPDAAGVAAAERILELAGGAGPDDLVLALISGGGSALLSLPGGRLTLEDKRQVNDALLRSGAAIAEMNCVRKHLSAIKGGRLAAAAHPAAVATLLISDVPGDDPAVIASGPTVPDPTTLADARAVLAQYAIRPSPAVAAHLDDPANETPKPGDKSFARAALHFVATPKMALEAAAAVAREAGVTPVLLGDAIEGEARDVAAIQASLALEIADSGPLSPRVLLSGGETTVTVRGKGRGGRNAEFLLALAIDLDGHVGVHALACDTDGIDGTEDNAGALIGPETLARAQAVGIDPRAALADNDAYALFKAIDGVVVTGPTLTNVNDFRAVLIV